MSRRLNVALVCINGLALALYILMDSGTMWGALAGIMFGWAIGTAYWNFQFDNIMSDLKKSTSNLMEKLKEEVAKAEAGNAKNRLEDG